MSRKNLNMKIVVLVAALAVSLAAANAQQNQTANQPQNQKQVQLQPVQQNQPVQQQQQPQQKKNFWQKVRDYSQTGQNVMQQGQNTVQQGTGGVQQGVQNGVQQIQNVAQQGTGGGQAANGFQGNGNSGSCGPSCFDAGPFQANVSQMTASQEGGWHVIRMTIQFHNASNQPLVIAYHDGSMVMVDNNGNTYIPAGGNPGQLQGMGIDRGTQTDSQFQLGPGQTGNALFSVARGRPANSPIGTSYSYNFTIDELQLQNGALAIPVRTYNLNFPTLAPGSSAAPFASGSSVANGMVGNGNRGSYTGATVQQGAAQAVPGQRGVGVATPQTRMVNGRPVTTVPTQSAPAAAVVNNAAMKTPVAATQAKPAAAVRPIPATTAVKPAATAPPKKATTATTTTK